MKSTISSCLRSALLAPLLLTLAAQAETGPAIPDFTFIQASDVHAPMPQSQTTIARVAELGEINLEPFQQTVPKPDFAIVTGDCNEFGGGSGSWEAFQSYWKGCNLPVYPIMGNHDNTWDANIRRLRDMGLGPFYSFDRHGCHFVALMTATPQDPRPFVGEEQILWLRKDLEKVGNRTPIFVFFHHPLGGSEFASAYDCERLLDELRGYNVALLMAGHSHGHVYRSVGGLDQITGGSTFGPNAGFAVISVKSNILRAAYWKAGQAAPDLKLFEKPLAAGGAGPKVEIATPAFRGVVTGALRVSARLVGAEEVKKAVCSVDGEAKGELRVSGAAPQWTAAGEIELAGLLPGAHHLRVQFETGAGLCGRSSEFFLETPGHPTAWRAYLGASSKATPAISEGAVFTGANDGKLRAFNAATGAELWAVETGAEILAEPLVQGGKVVTANGLGVVSAYTRAGEKLWSFQAGGAVYSSPVFAAGKVVFGCNDGKLYALELESGKQAWVNTNATYAIESKPFVWKDKVYFGAWDQFIRCVDAKEGKLLWEQPGEGSRAARGAKRYYSPADAMPVVADGKLMIADRAYALTILNADSGEPVGKMSKVAATGLSEDGKSVYLRRTDGQLTKIDSSGQPLWSVEARMGAIPTAPVEKNGVVYVCSGGGTVSAISARDGKLLWKYQASPQLYVMSSVACDGAKAYVTAFDGTLTAISVKAGR